MGKLNKLQIIGNLGGDPEVRTTPAGKKVATFSVATTRKWKDGEGNPKEETQWHKVVAWMKVADLVEKYLKKGSKVYCSGSIEYQSYPNKTHPDVTMYSCQMRLEDIEFLGGKSDGDNQQNQAPSLPAGDSFPPSGDDQDLPF